MGAFLKGHHARLRVAKCNSAMSQATETPFFFFCLEKDAMAFFSPLRLGKQ
jgi:hypothetical protein